MDIRELGRLDLNLLVALEALLEERNVSRAAERLFISQSAMSKTLGRLRQLFDDPLFIRKASGMVPTPRAEQLAQRLPEVLLAVQAMIEPADFDPYSCDREFNLLVPSHISPWALPLLVEQLVEKAPRVRINTISSDENQLDLLADGRLDFAIQVARRYYPPGFDVMTIGFAPSLLLARDGHPLQGRELTWDMVLAYPQVQLLIPELQEIIFLTDQDSDFLAHERAVVAQVQTDNLFTAAQVVRHSDYIFPAPPLFMEQEELSKDIIALPLPGGEEVVLKFVLTCHERIARSPAHCFVKAELVTAIERFRSRYGLPALQEMRRQRGLDY